MKIVNIGIWIEGRVKMYNKIAYYRESLELSQEELAKKVGISRGFLSDVENMKKQPSVFIALKIAKGLGEGVESIFFL